MSNFDRHYFKSYLTKIEEFFNDGKMLVATFKDLHTGALIPVMCARVVENAKEFIIPIATLFVGDPKDTVVPACDTADCYLALQSMDVIDNKQTIQLNENLN